MYKKLVWMETIILPKTKHSVQNAVFPDVIADAFTNFRLCCSTELSLLRGFEGPKRSLKFLQRYREIHHNLSA